MKLIKLQYPNEGFRSGRSSLDFALLTNKAQITNRPSAIFLVTTIQINRDIIYWVDLGLDDIKRHIKV